MRKENLQMALLFLERIRQMIGKGEKISHLKSTLYANYGSYYDM